MADLKTDYKDDVLDTTQNTRRKYQMINNQDGTVSFVDVTEYIQQGDSFGADDVNAITDAINKNDGVPVGAIVTFDGSQLPSGFEPYTTAEQSAIAQINDNLTENNLLSVVDLSSYNSFNNRYTFQSNGYLEIYAGGGGNVSCRIFGANATADTDTRLTLKETTNEASKIISVKKGMSVYHYALSQASWVKYYPLS